MYYLIDYDRPQTRIVSMQTFPDTDYAAAMKARLEIELGHFHRNIAHREVVVLQAGSLETLRHNHSRYFKTLQEHFDELVNAITAH